MEHKIKGEEMTLLDQDVQQHNRRRTDRVGDKTLAMRAYTPPDSSPLPDISLLPDAGVDASLRDHEKSGAQHILKIRQARTQENIGGASMLVQKMYATRGYPANPIKGGPMHFTLVASQHDRPVGTITLALDAGHGLAADQLYKEEVDKLRAEGCKLGEFTKLAIEKHVASKDIFASLLHLAYIYIRLIYKYTDVVLEVVPHHKKYYMEMLGCELLGGEKLNTRVNAPVNLLRLNGEYVDQMIAQYGGLREQADTRSLYAYFYSKEDADGIMQRLLRDSEE